MKKDLEEDLHLLSDGLNEAEGHRERTMAELELQESNRLQLQKVSHIRCENEPFMNLLNFWDSEFSGICLFEISV